MCRAEMAGSPLCGSARVNPASKTADTTSESTVSSSEPFGEHGVAHYDLIVIGSGPAGQKAAINAAKLAKRVALVEARSAPGGDCLHTGAVPSKAMREAILHLTGLRERSIYGDAYSVKDQITMRDLIFRARTIIQREINVIRAHMRRNNVELLEGRASFVDPHTIRIGRLGHFFEITGDCILIATGAGPARPESVPFTPGRIVDTDELLDLEDLPPTMIIVGAGVVGVEYACMLQAVGVRVTLVESRPRMLEFIDEEIRQALLHHMRVGGMRVLFGETVERLWTEGESCFAALESGKTLAARTILYAIGRQGRTADLALENAGLEADRRGRLTVNERYQTSAPHILAVGDVVGFPALASTSMEQGRLATCYAFDAPAESHPELFPFGIYTIPEISTVGQDEASLTEQRVPYEVGVARYSEIARGQILGDGTGFLKLLFHRDSGRILGAHVLGTGAAELVHIAQTAMAYEGTIDFFVRNVFNYPTLAECYRVAALDGLNRLAAYRPQGAAEADNEPLLFRPAA